LAIAFGQGIEQEEVRFNYFSMIESATSGIPNSKPSSSLSRQVQMLFPFVNHRLMLLPRRGFIVANIDGSRNLPLALCADILGSVRRPKHLEEDERI